MYIYIYKWVNELWFRPPVMREKSLAVFLAKISGFQQQNHGTYVF